MTIVGTLAAVISNMVFNAADAFTDSALRLQAHGDHSSAMDRVQRELQGIPLDTGAAQPAPLIASISPGSISFGSGRSLTLSGTNLVFHDGTASATLLTDVSAFTVRGLSSTGAALATTLAPADMPGVQRLEVTITVTRNGVSETLRTRVFPRGILSGAGA
jgi:hypothetical protein